MTKLAPDWVQTNDPVIRSPARYRWTTAPAYEDGNAIVNKIDHFSSYNGLSEDDKCNIFPMALKNRSSNWYEDLSQD